MKSILKIVDNEKEKQEFIDTMFMADITIKRDNNKILSVLDNKENTLFIFKTPKEGYLSMQNFSGVEEVTMSTKTHNDMLFYSELARLMEGLNYDG